MFEQGRGSNLRSIGKFRRVNFGRNDYKTILKNPHYHRMLLQAKRDSEAGKGIEMSLGEFQQWLGLE
ncbi:hypothetical protein [Longimicrobium sp.]|uniref:hypothetical protein n=1 Tax=Longimicrobium sp. TaxID=2029185 RepID=UPI002D0A566B|nr:hypothetical protein [Longimicrobium sp.]HSU13854.1 hypothetical protein [Longimicrobium sp.]